MGAPSLSRGPCLRPKSSPASCVHPQPQVSPLTRHVQLPGPPPRQHLAPAAGWRGWRCPRCWKLGRCRPRRCFAPPSGSAAFRSAPRAGVSERDPGISSPTAGLRRPCTSKASQQREAAGQARGSRGQALLRRVSQPGLTPSVLQPVPRPPPAPHCPAAGLTCT